MTPDYLSSLTQMRDKAIINNDAKSVNKYNDKIDEYLLYMQERSDFSVSDFPKKKSSRFSVRKQRPNVSRESSSMGYAKPIHNQRISSKYNCMVTGEKRMNPCAGCSNVQGCISNSMQYKESQT